MTKLLNRPWLKGQRFGNIVIISGTTGRNRWGNVTVTTRCDGCGMEKERILANLVYQGVKQCRACSKKKVPIAE